MSPLPTIPSEEREQLLRESWLSHDARWFNAVAAEFGIEAANRANRKAIRDAGVVEARRLLKRLGGPPVRSISDFLAFSEAGRAIFVGDLVEMRAEPAGDSAYATEVTRCFAAENIARAGLAATYECGIFDRLQGWHHGVGLPLEEPVPATTCLLANGAPCRRTLRISRTPTAD